jgi:hypothetical protein
MSIAPEKTGPLSKADAVVACHSGHSYAQRPTAFWWEDERFDVTTIGAEWRSPAGKHFRVTTKNNSVFELIYVEASDIWQIRQA